MGERSFSKKLWEERCLIGCGCGRNRSKNVTKLRKLKAKRVATLKQKRLAAKALVSKIPITDSLKRKEVCKSCPYGAQTSREQKAGIYVCHKTNRLIDNLIVDAKFNCPIKRWN